MSERAHYLTTVEWFNLNTVIQPICKMFDYQVFLVGSCLEKRDFRDVDIRIIKDDYIGILSSEYERKVISMIISEWLSNRTGLLIDLQMQAMKEADQFKGKRIALGLTI